MVNVLDVNDNAPVLVNPSMVVPENSAPSKLGELVAFDADDYSKGKLTYLSDSVRRTTQMLTFALAN